MLHESPRFTLPPVHGEMTCDKILADSGVKNLWIYLLWMSRVYWREYYNTILITWKIQKILLKFTYALGDCAVYPVLLGPLQDGQTVPLRFLTERVSSDTFPSSCLWAARPLEGQEAGLMTQGYKAALPMSLPDFVVNFPLVLILEVFWALLIWRHRSGSFLSDFGAGTSTCTCDGGWCLVPGSPGVRPWCDKGQIWGPGAVTPYGGTPWLWACCPTAGPPLPHGSLLLPHSETVL